jgi:hypothetical protein
MEVIFVLFVVFAIIGRVLMAMAAGRAMQQQFQQLQQFGQLQQFQQLQWFEQAYNAAIEQQIRMLMSAVQTHQPGAAVHHQQVVQQIQSLPTAQRRRYTAELDDAMSGFELNPRTGEWEKRRR